MKKLNLKLGSIKEMLTKEQMKNVIGGNDYGGSICWSTFFYTASRGCGYAVCNGKLENGNCDCEIVIETPQPCGYAR